MDMCWIYLVLDNIQRRAFVELVINRRFSKKEGNLSISFTFRHRASSIQDRRFATLQRTLFIYLINISLSDICLTVHH